MDHIDQIDQMDSIFFHSNRTYRMVKWCHDVHNINADHRGGNEQRSHSGIQSLPDFRMTSGLAAMLKESLQSMFCCS